MPAPHPLAWVESLMYPKGLVRRIKGALQFLEPKQVSYLTGIPYETLREWKAESAQAAVEPDPSVLSDIKIAILRQSL